MAPSRSLHKEVISLMCALRGPRVKDGVLGPWMGVPNVACRFYEMAMSSVAISDISLLILKQSNVTS